MDIPKSLNFSKEVKNKVKFNTDYLKINTVKPAHTITSIKQSPVLKGYLFLVLSHKFSYKLIFF